MTRNILHVDIDAFFVSVERLLDPSLRGKPVIVGGDPRRRGVVASASYEARAYGVHSAMPLSRAKKLCPQAIFIQGTYHLYGEFSDRVYEIFARYAPAIEPLSLDEAFLDLSGTERLYGHIVSAAELIKGEVERETGLTVSIGIAANKLLAKIASDLAKPNGLLRVLPGHEAAFLAPLPVGRLWGVGEATGKKLALLGIKTIGELARISPELLEITFGKFGAYLYRAARGIGDEEVCGPEGAKSIGRETTFDVDTIDRQFIESTLAHLTAKAAAELRSSGLQARTVTIKVRFSDFSTITRSATLKEPTDKDSSIYREVLSLLDRSSSRRARVRLVGVSLSNLCRYAQQLALFGFARERKLSSFYAAVDRIRGKYGFNAVVMGRAALLDGLLKRRRLTCGGEAPGDKAA